MSLSNTEKTVRDICRNTRRVRRQTLWDHWGLFLRDTFLPIASPV